MSACSKCGRPAQINRDSCMYCGAPIAAEPDSGLALKCPRCSAWMNRETIDGMELDICYGCGGTWYDKGELKERVQTHRSGAGEAGPDILRAQTGVRRKSDVEEVVYLACPRCHKQMVRRNFGRASGVIVDVCGFHGLFLDVGEFEKILRFEENDGSVRAEERRLQQLKAREREVRRDMAARQRRESLATLHRDRRRGSLLERALWDLLS